jgi:hypothetical protein
MGQAARYFFCAWVLWAEWGGGMQGSYMPYRFQPVEAFMGKADCEAFKARAELSKG